MEQEFNEDKAVEYMQQHGGASKIYDADQLLNLIDIIWDYYEDNGLLSADVDDYNELDPDALIAYARKLLAKDKGNEIAPADVEGLVRAELDYEASLEE